MKRVCFYAMIFVLAIGTAKALTWLFDDEIKWSCDWGYDR